MADTASRANKVRKPSLSTRKAIHAEVAATTPLVSNAKKKKLTDVAYEVLEELIVTLKIAPGTAVTETELCRITGIGRTPVREAVLRLSRESLVVILPQRGLLVAEIDVKKQLRLLETRREVERIIARSAARKATPSERQRFAEIVHGFKQSNNNNDELMFILLDREFNELCLQAARNEFATGAMQLMHGLSRRFWYYHYKQSADIPMMAKLHAAVALAIAGSDQDGAAKALDELQDYIEEFTRATVFVDA